MKKVIFGVVKLLTYLVNCLSLINLRALVFASGVLLALISSRLAWLAPLDTMVLSANSFLFKSPPGSSEIAIVDVPQQEIDIWQSDVHASGNLTLLLSNMLSSPNTTVGIMLSEPIDTGAGLADKFIADFIVNETAGDIYKNASALAGNRSILLDLLSNERVVLGVDSLAFLDQAPLMVRARITHQLPQAVREGLWPVDVDSFVPKSLSANGMAQIDQYPILTASAPSFRAAYHGMRGETYSSFLVEFLRAAQGIDAKTPLMWDKEQSLSVGRYHIPLSMSASFVPLHSLSERLSPIVSRISLNEALARSAFPDTILIASSSNDMAMVFAEALYSIRDDSVFFSPWWHSPLTVLLTLAFTLYLVFVVTSVRLRAASLLTLILVSLALLSQTVVLLWKGYWLPFALPLAWLVFGQLLLTVWVVKRRKVQGLVNRAEDICIRHAKSLIKTKQLDLAVEHLSFCSPQKPLLQTLYEISDAYAEQKNFAKAVDVLSTIRKKQRSFKDTEQKLQVLKTMLQTQKLSKSEKSLQKTEVIGEPREIKTLGRYQVEREIGRGAMGRVYLGFDPRIARRLAIKTLSYEHFKGKERLDIKSRFFREAEAAGRLSHPSIVSVYDVGEDGDQAYIAMDFVDGDALSNFVNGDSLLPVFEVYRIVYDVAIALEYAHANNIVHRDVKPGNIIYNPSPYQIRVTDFGIARLTDDSKTSTGEILGSPLYMAPEQLKGKKVNRAADIFSLGVTFYQLLTGQLPYRGENLAALTYEIIHGKHKNVRTIRKDLPASASRIVNQALQKEAGDRYETAAEMAIVLKKAIKRDFSVQAKRVGYI